MARFRTPCDWQGANPGVAFCATLPERLPCSDAENLRPARAKVKRVYSKLICATRRAAERAAERLFVFLATARGARNSQRATQRPAQCLSRVFSVLVQCAIAALQSFRVIRPAPRGHGNRAGRICAPLRAAQTRPSAVGCDGRFQRYDGRKHHGSVKQPAARFRFRTRSLICENALYGRADLIHIDAAVKGNRHVVGI